MIHGRRVVVVMPAFRAARTLERCVAAIPRDVVDLVLLVDDGSDDETLAVARRLGLPTRRHETNQGYGANQKSCYRWALEADADIVVMLHPDYQYEPRLITAMAAMVASGVYDVVLGSRILGRGARKGGMLWWRYVANRALTIVQNLLLGTGLSEFHTGFRAFSRRALSTLPLAANSSDFVFDNELIVQAVAFGMPIGELSCPTRYFDDASTISFARSVVYGIGVLRNSVLYRLWRMRLARPRFLSSEPALRLDAASARNAGTA